MTVTGDILEIPLGKNIGFAYCKVVFSKDVNPNVPENTMLYVYDFISYTSLSDCSELDGVDWLTNPLLLFGEIEQVKKQHLRFLCNKKLNDSELIIPSYREDGPFPTQECSVVVNFQNKRVWPVPMEACRHLGQWTHINQKFIPWILTFLWLRKLSKNVADYFPDIEEKANWKIRDLLGLANRMIFLKDVALKDRFRIIE